MHIHVYLYVHVCVRIACMFQVHVYMVCIITLSHTFELAHVNLLTNHQIQTQTQTQICPNIMTLARFLQLVHFLPPKSERISSHSKSESPPKKDGSTYTCMYIYTYIHTYISQLVHFPPAKKRTHHGSHRKSGSEPSHAKKDGNTPPTNASNRLSLPASSWRT